MSTRVSALRCDGCGAPLAVQRGATVTCSYCMRELVVVATGTQVTAQRDARSLTDELLHGYSGRDVGEGRRYSVAEMKARDWWSHEHAVWPNAARASTSFGGGWSASALVGPPLVYPSHGDLRGAWAPRTRDSHVEWVEVDYPNAPPARAIRVFETNDPGASFAVTAIDGAHEELIWQRPPTQLRGGSQVLEIDLPAPRRITRLRVYVSNAHGASWCEIDTIGLVSAEPLPPAMRSSRPRLRRHRGCVVVLGAATVISACVIGLALSGGSTEPWPMPPAPAERVSGTSLTTWPAGDVAGTRWATEVVAFSSQYSDRNNSAARALGMPDVFPRYDDEAEAWAPSRTDAGGELIELAFGSPVRTSAVLIVETLGAGAIRRVDDVTPGREPAILWEGESGTADEARILAIRLSEAREISAVRLVLDTSRASGWNEIDAVGLSPAP